MIEVFKTNVEEGSAGGLLAVLRQQYPSYRFNFDLQDCDRVLRVESSSDLNVAGLLTSFERLGLEAEVLEDVVPSV